MRSEYCEFAIITYDITHLLIDNNLLLKQSSVVDLRTHDRRMAHEIREPEKYSVTVELMMGLDGEWKEVSHTRVLLYCCLAVSRHLVRTARGQAVDADRIVVCCSIRLCVSLASARPRQLVISIDALVQARGGVWCGSGRSVVLNAQRNNVQYGFPDNNATFALPVAVDWTVRHGPQGCEGGGAGREGF